MTQKPVVKKPLKADKFMIPFQLKRPRLPKAWDCLESLEKVKTKIYDWTHITIEILKELYIAREHLAAQGERTDLGEKSPKLKLNWTDYCIRIGSKRNTVNGWLRRYYGKSRLEEPEEVEVLPEEFRLEFDTVKCMSQCYPHQDRLFGDKCKIDCPRKSLCLQIAKILRDSPILIAERRAKEQKERDANS